MDRKGTGLRGDSDGTRDGEVTRGFEFSGWWITMMMMMMIIDY